MRFLMLNWRDPRNPLAGGAERVSLAYLRELLRRGHEVFWFANDFAGALPEETIEGITVVRGGGKGSSIVKAAQWHRRQKRFDLVIDQHHGLPWYAPWWCGTNCIAYIHEVLGPIWESFYSWPVSAVGRWQERWTHWLYRNVPFWTPSDSTRRALQEHGVRSVTVFPNGTDTEPLPEFESKPLELPVRLVAVSRLAPNKRVDHALRALAILLSRGTAAHLTVVGTGETEESLRTLTADLGITSHVVFAGKLDEEAKNRQLQNAHILIHASVREGWGLNVIEANALGTPAVVYPVDGLVDSTVQGETGIVTNAEAPETIASAVESLVKAPEHYDCLRAAAWARSKTFQWKEVLPRTCDWLEERAKGRPAR
jgi:glycosyltransferase involved in cell wall biosynthesis